MTGVSFPKHAYAGMGWLSSSFSRLFDQSRAITLLSIMHYLGLQWVHAKRTYDVNSRSDRDGYLMRCLVREGNDGPPCDTVTLLADTHMIYSSCSSLRQLHVG